MEYILRYRSWAIHRSEEDGHFEAWLSHRVRIIEKKRTSKRVDRVVLHGTNLDGCLLQLDRFIDNQRIENEKRARDMEILKSSQLRIE